MTHARVDRMAFWRTLVWQGFVLVLFGVLGNGCCGSGPCPGSTACNDLEQAINGGQVTETLLQDICILLAGPVDSGANAACVQAEEDLNITVAVAQAIYNEFCQGSCETNSAAVEPSLATVQQFASYFMSKGATQKADAGPPDSGAD